MIEDRPCLYRWLVTGLAAESAVTVAALILLARATVRRIGGAFSRLGEAFRAVRDGDLDHRLTFHDYDGLADVAQAFNEMMDAERARSKKP